MVCSPRSGPPLAAPRAEPWRRHHAHAPDTAARTAPERPAGRPNRRWTRWGRAVVVAADRALSAMTSPATWTAP